MDVDKNMDEHYINAPNCILGHELKEMFASSSRRIECNECSKIVLRTQSFWGCNFCIYDLCTQCYYNKDYDNNSINRKSVEILTINNESTDNGNEEIEAEDNDNHHHRIQTKRTPISLFLNLYPQHPKIQQQIRLSLQFYDNPQQLKMQYPNTNTMQFPSSKNYSTNNFNNINNNNNNNNHNNNKKKKNGNYISKLYPPECSKFKF